MAENERRRSNNMPTYFDVIQQEDLELAQGTFVYLVNVSSNKSVNSLEDVSNSLVLDAVVSASSSSLATTDKNKFAIKAVSVQPDDLRNDPDTAANWYWPINIDKLLSCNTLFLEDKLTTRALSTDEVISLLDIDPNKDPCLPFSNALGAGSSSAAAGRPQQAIPAPILTPPLLNGILTISQYASFSPHTREIISNRPVEMRTLMQEYRVTYEDIRRLVGERWGLERLLNKMGNIRALVVEAHIPMATLLALPSDPRCYCINQSEDVVRLINELHIPVDDLLTLFMLLEEGFSVAQLLNQVHMPIADLLAVPDPLRRQLIHQSFGVNILVDRAHMAIADLLALPEAVRTLFIDHALGVDYLVNRARMPLARIQALAEPLRTLLVTKFESVSHLLQDLRIPIDTLLALPEEVIILFLHNTYGLNELVNEAHMPVANLFARAELLRGMRKYQVEESFLSFLIKKVTNVLQLVNEAHMPIANLLALEESWAGRFIEGSAHVVQLINEVPISIVDFLALRRKTQDLFLANAPRVVALIRSNISLEHLMDLSDVDLRTVLRNNPQREAQEILDHRPSFHILLRYIDQQLAVLPHPGTFFNRNVPHKAFSTLKAMLVSSSTSHAPSLKQWMVEQLSNEPYNKAISDCLPREFDASNLFHELKDGDEYQRAGRICYLKSNAAVEKEGSIPGLRSYNLDKASTKNVADFGRLLSVSFQAQAEEAGKSLGMS